MRAMVDAGLSEDSPIFMPKYGILDFLKKISKILIFSIDNYLFE